MSRQTPNTGSTPSPAPGGPAPTGPPPAPSPREYLRILVIAALGLSFFGALLAALLAGSTAADTVPIAVIASVIGWLMATALQQRETRHQSAPAPAS